ADRNRSHWSTSKTPSYTKSVSWQHHLQKRGICDGMHRTGTIKKGRK
ncbi:transposase, partial [Escherichia coli]